MGSSIEGLSSLFLPLQKNVSMVYEEFLLHEGHKIKSV